MLNLRMVILRFVWRAWLAFLIVCWAQSFTLMSSIAIAILTVMFFSSFFNAMTEHVNKLHASTGRQIAKMK